MSGAPPVLSMPTAAAARVERQQRLSTTLSRALEEHGVETWWHKAGLDYGAYILDKLHGYDAIAPRATCKAAGVPLGSTYGQVCWHLAPMVRDLLKERDGLTRRERLVEATGSATVSPEMIANLPKLLQPADGRPWWKALGLGTAQALTGALWASRDRAPDAVCDAAGVAYGTTFSALARKLRAELPKTALPSPRPQEEPPVPGLTIEDLMAECALRLRRMHQLGADWWEEYGADRWWSLSAKLWSCTRTAPPAACRVLGMPVGSTFAQLVRVLRTDLRYRAPVHDFSPVKKKPRAIPAEVTDGAIEDMPETFGATMVAVLLGVPCRTVEYWLQQGWLSGDRGRRGYWEITRDGLQEFLRVRPWAVEWRMTGQADE